MCRAKRRKLKIFQQQLKASPQLKPQTCQPAFQIGQIATVVQVIHCFPSAETTNMSTCLPNRPNRYRRTGDTLLPLS
ncbi:hypothetical protein RRG08_065914 [Elysia crispata]|uniref:Uncharacterized protein n=1 Tax=Elysia crispata TaxID=231223 RepID=A0AAE1ADU2_9GAST|nr:hypothetical protein RRG08_065914 [Elysia crispata]